MARSHRLPQFRRVVDAAREAYLLEDPSRRRFVRQAALATGATLGLGSRAWSQSSGGGGAQVVVVGGGMAGVLAAYRLHQAGVDVTVYEASERVGGRMYSDTGSFLEGQVSERGGESIDSVHSTMRGLVDELGLQLQDRYANDDGLLSYLEIDGREYRIGDIYPALAPIFAAATLDSLRAGPLPSYRRSTPFGRELDGMSVDDWLDARVPGGKESLGGKFMQILVLSEWGIEPSRLSSINVVYSYSLAAARGLPNRLRRPLDGGPSDGGGADERFWVVGGNQQVPRRLADAMPGRVLPGHRLIAATTDGDRTRLDFDTPGGPLEVVADRVVMAVPFTVLRGVDLAGLELGPVKRRAIDELGMGTNGKLAVQFDRRVWREQGYTGAAGVEGSFQSSWDQSAVLSGKSGLLVDYTGGFYGAGMGQGTVDQRARLFLRQIEPIYPGVGAAWNGRALRSHWTGSPNQLGSYSGYTVGQFSTLRLAEGEVEGTVHFAGEHTCPVFPAYMEGAARSGERVAAEVLDGLGVQVGRLAVGDGVRRG